MRFNSACFAFACKNCKSDNVDNYSKRYDNADCLRKRRAERRSGRTNIEHAHKQVVQTDIGSTCHSNKIHRTFGIAHTTKNGADLTPLLWNGTAAAIGGKTGHFDEGEKIAVKANINGSGLFDDDPSLGAQIIASSIYKIPLTFCSDLIILKNSEIANT